VQVSEFVFIYRSGAFDGECGVWLGGPLSISQSMVNDPVRRSTTIAIDWVDRLAMRGVVSGLCRQQYAKGRTSGQLL